MFEVVLILCYFGRLNLKWVTGKIYNGKTVSIGETRDRATEWPEIVEDLLRKALAFDQGMQKDKRQPVWRECAQIPAMKPPAN